MPSIPNFEFQPSWSTEWFFHCVNFATDSAKHLSSLRSVFARLLKIWMKIDWTRASTTASASGFFPGNSSTRASIRVQTKYRQCFIICVTKCMLAKICTYDSFQIWKGRFTHTIPRNQTGLFLFRGHDQELFRNMP
jgi:hypothetical protein